MSEQLGVTLPSLIELASQAALLSLDLAKILLEKLMNFAEAEMHQLGLKGTGGRPYLISGGDSTEVEMITQA